MQQKVILMRTSGDGGREGNRIKSDSTRMIVVETTTGIFRDNRDEELKTPSLRKSLRVPNRCSIAQHTKYRFSRGKNTTLGGRNIINRSMVSGRLAVYSVKKGGV
jgi:hypothetical protein